VSAFCEPLDTPQQQARPGGAEGLEFRFKSWVNKFRLPLRGALVT